MFFFTVFHSDRSGVAGAARKERRAVPERSRGLGEGAGPLCRGRRARGGRRNEEEMSFPPTLSHGREAFHFAGRERLFNGGTIAKDAKGVAGSIAVETLDDLPVLLSKAMKI